MSSRTAPRVAVTARRSQLIARASAVVRAGLFGGLVVTVFGVGAHQVAHGEQFEVRQVDVVGARHASANAVRHLANVRQGEHLTTVDLNEAARGAVLHPWVRRAEARRSFPGRVEIIVEEHNPAMLLALDALWYVDVDGVVFKRAENAALDFPLLTGVDPELVQTQPGVSRAIVDAALDVLRAAEGHAHAPPQQISELRFDARLGFTMVLRNGTELVIGFTDPGARLDRLDRLVAAGLDPKVPQRVDLDADTVAIATPLADPV